DPGRVVPGGRYEVTFDAPTVGETLSVATMWVQSNDLFITNGVTGIPLFDSAGEPLAERDITDLVELWDAGTEVNQAPGYGPDQPLQSGGVPNVGAPEGGISVFNHPTRALPNASQLMEVTVVDNGADFTVTVRNATGDASAGMPIAPVFYAAHSDEWSLFTVGEAASAGLEILAEDGSPMTLVDEHTDAAGTVHVGAQAVVVDGTDPGPSSPGQSYEFTINPTAAAPYVTFAAMAVATNDVFIAPPAEGIRFIDEAGARRAVAEIEADIRAQLDVWDAGTEINQVPGVGPDQPMNGGEDIGAADPIVGVRRYRDSTNDLDGADNFVNITVAESGGEFTIEFSNISDGTAYPAMLTPIGWALHDANTSLFTPGEQASVGIERIAEDGDASELNTALASVSGVDQNGIEGAAPIMSGETYTLVVTPTVNGRFLSFATMVVPSNDAFIGNSTGVALLDETGTPRPALMVVNELLSAIQIYDAGTEANEV
ncbi:MAG: spondin domain-containing protein, partial [Myxococcota bacterium]